MPCPAVARGSVAMSLEVSFEAMMSSVIHHYNNMCITKHLLETNVHSASPILQTGTYVYVHYPTTLETHTMYPVISCKMLLLLHIMYIPHGNNTEKRH